MRKVVINRPDLIRLIADLESDLAKIETERVRKRRALDSLKNQLKYADSEKKRQQIERKEVAWLSRPLLYPKKS